MSSCIWEKANSLTAAFWENCQAPCPVYDMHGHMGSHNAIYMKRSDPESMACHLRRAGVRRLIFSHHWTLLGNRRNAEDVEICKAYPDLFRLYAAILPDYPDYIREDLAQFDRWRPYAVGLKILPDYYRVPATDKRFAYALDFAEERGIPVLFHTWGGSEYNGGSAMLKLVEKYHNLKFFFGHSLYGDWETAARCVNEFAGNVYLELTAIPGQRGLIEKLCALAGSEHLLYGTDLPWFDEHQAMGGVLSADISEDDMRNILYRNAEKLLGKDF